MIGNHDGGGGGQLLKLLKLAIIVQKNFRAESQFLNCTKNKINLKIPAYRVT